MKRKTVPWRLPHLKDDGLVTPEVRDYAEDKYRLLRHYAFMFSTSMKGKCDHRVYIDLFAGADRSRIEGTGSIVPASPLLALELPSKFDKYIFCEQDEGKISALRSRVERVDPNANATYVCGDVNSNVGEILSAIPKGKILAFCFVDPYKISDLRFDTLRSLSPPPRSSRNVDFLVLLPSYMDANRAVSVAYIEEENKAIGSFLGAPDWREDWQQAESRGVKFPSFFVQRFGDEMKKMGYVYPEVKEAKLVRTTRKVPLYHLAFFSRHPLGADFWRKAKDYGTDQRSFSFED